MWSVVESSMAIISSCIPSLTHIFKASIKYFSLSHQPIEGTTGQLSRSHTKGIRNPWDNSGQNDLIGFRHDTPVRTPDEVHHTDFRQGSNEAIRLVTMRVRHDSTHFLEVDSV